jgi:hypothetical protein
MINTTKGIMDETLLRKVTGIIDNENELTNWIEYYDGEELVHRSAHVQLKQNVICELIAEGI